MKGCQIPYFIAFLVILGTFWSAETYAQGREIRGNIISETSGEPIPLATISISRLKTGTSSDENGFFMLELRNARANDRVRFSCVGFESVSLQVSELSTTSMNEIKLKPSVFILEEQVVSAEEQDPRSIVEKAARNRKKVMSSKPYLITSVFDEEVRINSKLAGAAQGFGVTYMEGFREREFSRRNQPMDQIQWKQIRRTSYDMQDIDYTPYIGSYKTLKIKDIYLYDGPVSVSRIPNYSYKLDSITYYNDRLVYMISFESTANKGVAGKVMIDEEDYSILTLEVVNRSDRKALDYFNKDLKPVSSKFRMSMSRVGKIYYINAIELTIISEKSQDGKNYVIEENYHLDAGQYNSSAIRTNPAQKKVLFYEMVNPQMNYSAAFWEANSEISFPIIIDADVKKQFEANHGKRIVDLPDGFSNYQDLYNDRQLLDLYFADF